MLYVPHNLGGEFCVWVEVLLIGSTRSRFDCSPPGDIYLVHNFNFFPEIV